MFGKRFARTRLKVCCISSAEELALAIQLGADCVGLVSNMPSGPGVIPESLIAELVALCPPGVTPVLLTSATSADAIAAQHERTRATCLQLCDAVDADELRALKRGLPHHVSLMQVLHVTGDSAVAEARSVTPFVDALLLDSGRPDLAVKQLGGTGRTHDWSVSRAVVEASDVPVFLAGGLNSDNVADAVAQVRPYGVDLCTGVRTAGALDEAKLTAFTAALG